MSAIFFMTNLGVSHAAGFDTIDLALVIGGVVTWAASGMQSIYCRIKAFKDVPEDAPAPKIRPSTHSLINSSLLTTSAIFYIAGDIYHTTTPSLVRNVRLTGSSLWLLSSLTAFWLSLVLEIKQEDHPDLRIKLFSLDPSIFLLACEFEYFLSGICFAIAIYKSEPIPAWKAAGNSCWLLASTLETVRTLTGMKAPEQTNIISELPSPTNV
jgi:hypothetical protein